MGGSRRMGIRISGSVNVIFIKVNRNCKESQGRFECWVGMSCVGITLGQMNSNLRIRIRGSNKQ